MYQIADDGCFAGPRSERKKSF